MGFSASSSRTSYARAYGPGGGRREKRKGEKLTALRRRVRRLGIQAPTRQGQQSRTRVAAGKKKGRCSDGHRCSLLHEIIEQGYGVPVYGHLHKAVCEDQEDPRVTATVVG